MKINNLVSFMMILLCSIQSRSQTMGHFETRTGGRAVAGFAEGGFNENIGGYFRTSGSTGQAVYGWATATSAENYGGYFQAEGHIARAVFGLASSVSDKNYGGWFKAKGTTGRGVYGISTNANGLNYGGYFQADGNIGRAVFGLANGTSNVNYGGYFKAKGRAALGVYGEASDVNGTNYGGYFLAKSINGRAVFGLAEYTPDGSNYGGWFKGKGTKGGTGVYAWGNVYDFYADGPGMNYASSSSVRWKSNIRNIDHPLQKISQLRGVYYDWDQDHGGLHDIGFIAEEVGKVVPEVVQYEANGIDAKGLDYSKMTPLLVEAMNAMRTEYQEKFNKQEKEINDLKSKIAALEQLLQRN